MAQRSPETHPSRRAAATTASAPGRQSTAKCGRCGTKQLLTIPPDWDRRSFVQTYCTKCSYRFLLPTRRLQLLQLTALVVFPLCVWFVIHTIMRAQ